MIARALALVVALLAPAAAWADPVSIASIAIYAAQAYNVISAATAFWLTVAVVAVGAANQRRKARKVAATQRAQYNASLQDRTVTVLRGDPPWQVIYGRCIVGGAIVDIVTTDKPGAHRENGEIYTKADAYKHLVIVLAAHEVQAIHEVYIDGVAVGTLDGSGWVTAGDFFRERTDSRRVVFTGSTTPAEPPLEVLQAYSVEGTGDSETYVPRTVTISGGTTLVGPAGIEVVCDYLVQDDVRSVRVRKHLGGAGQAVDAFLASAAPTRYTSAHKLEGLAYIVVTLDLEDVRFQGGPPNITADVSGRLLYDPRTSTTAWSANPALVVRDFLTAEWGYGADPATEIDDAYVIAAANACDEPIDLDVGGTVTTGQPRYTCNGAFTTDAAAEATLEDLAASMAGTVAYGGSWQVMAGVWTAPVMALTDDDLHGMVEVAQADTPMDDLANGVRGQYIASGSQTPTDFNPYQNATFLAADDGRELWQNVSLPFTDNVARARNLCRVMLEGNRSGQVLRYPAKLRAWPLQVGDRVTVTCAEYGLTAKAYRVTDWQFDIAAPVLLTLQEDAEEIYDLADAAVADPTPNTDLPNPWFVAAMAGVTATSGGDTLLLLADGTLVPRVKVTWTPRTDAYVTEGGRIEVLWRRPNTTEWQQTAVPGAEAAAWITGVDEGDLLVIEVRAVNSLGARSVSTFLSHTVVGKEGNPSDVTGLDWQIKPGQVWITWDPCPDADYAATELRYGGTGWDDATFLWRGAASDYQHPRPPNGTYVVRAKHIDTSGNYSVNAASVSVTVDDSIDSGTSGTVELTTDRDPYFAFPDGTSHVSSSPELTITAQLVGLQGLVSWTAKAYTSGGTLLGDITLGAGSGNVRTMTGAAFAAPGSSGSVAYADVRATHPNGAFDELRVYRQDPTITTPRLYLTNRVASIATDEYGNGGDYSQAYTSVAVVVGITNVSSTWTFAITPDAGVSSTINGGAGPVTGTASVTVAVSAMTIPSGAVAIAASKTGETTLTDSFRVEKNEASGGLNAYWDPRAEIVLPLGADGQVSSYADAYSSLVIARAGGQDDSATWAYAIDLLQNVTATLTGNRVDITGVVPLGTVAASVSDSLTLPAGWTRPQSLVWTPLGWVMFGYHASGTWQHVLTSPDFLTWTSRDMGSAGRWEFGAGTDDGVVVAVEFGVVGTDKVIRSLDGGFTWGTVGSLGVSAQWQSIQDMGDRIIVCSNGSTAARQSTDNGGSWSALTLPDTSCDVFGGPGRYIARSSSALYYRSANGGSSWSASIAALAGINSYTIKLFKGRLVFIPLAGSTARYSEDGGATWVTATLQHDVGSGPRMCEVVRGVLYLVGSDGKLQFTVDGKAWRTAGTTATLSQQILAQGGYRDIQADLLPCIYTSAGNYAVRTPLLATSEVEGGVRVRASKAGENDVVRFLPVRRGAITSGGYAFSASPRTLSLPSTSDGYVTDFSTASITVQAQKDGIDYTADWTVAWTATNMTPSSGSGATATFTAMSTGADRGTVTFSGSKPGENTVYGTFDIVKLKGTTSSGPRDGAIYAPVEAATTFVGVRFKTDGSVHVKRGSGGSYLPYAQWAGAVRSGAGTGVWINVAPVAGTHALSSGTTGTWLELTSDRDFEMSDASSGTHRFEADLYLGTSSSGANAVGSVLRMTLIVP